MLAQCLREMGGYCVKEICIYSVCICMSWIVSDLFIKVKNEIKKRTHAPFFKEIVTRNNLFILPCLTIFDEMQTIKLTIVYK